MRIITVNLPLSYLGAIDSLTGEKGLYPSRSELIRVACRDFLIKELEAAKAFVKYQNQITTINAPKIPEIDPSLFVQVPIENTELSGNVEYKTYRIVKK
jgi:Arc/MetJ-type ribon-helix-helix transcriptional regulator